MQERDAKLLVMGVSGSGKSTIGAALAQRLGAAFIDADDLHPEENVAAMAAGLPLTDDMRWPWLDACAAAMQDAGAIVLACSALRRAYRDRLRAAVPGLQLVYPRADRALIERRMSARKDHFMPVSLLDSQFATLEPPGADETPISVSVAPPVPEIVDRIIARLTA